MLQSPLGYVLKARFLLPLSMSDSLREEADPRTYLLTSFTDDRYDFYTGIEGHGSWATSALYRGWSCVAGSSRDLSGQGQTAKQGPARDAHEVADVHST